MSYSKSLLTNTNINSIIAGFQYGSTGPTGTTGYTGSTGPTGPTGSTGYTGSTGPSLPIEYQGYGSLLLYNQANNAVFYNDDISFNLISDDNSSILNITGDVTASGTINASQFQTISDYRIKDNIKKLDDTFTVKYLNPVSYINNQLHKTDFGLIAHELQEYFPELVTGEKDGAGLQTINYVGLIPILIKEIQKLNERVQKLENRLKNKKRY